MTPREVKEMLYAAAQSGNAELALTAAKAFEKAGLWTSTAHFDPITLNGTEVLKNAQYPGTCVECQKEFSVGSKIRWRARVASHEVCWNKWKENNEPQV